MASSTTIFLCFVMISSSLFLPSSAQTCSSFSFSDNRVFARCTSLPRLGSSLHWTYNPTAGTVDIAYRAPQSSSGWVAWALNPSGGKMVGAQALVAFQNSSGVMTAYKTPITSKSPTMQPGELSFPVANLASAFVNNVMTIFATVTLPSNTTTTLQHVWQASSSVSNNLPGVHPMSGDNLLSFGDINFLSGEASSAGGNSRLRRRNTHGVLNAISWGVLMPIGAIIARYLRVFKSADPAWFYLHIACQSSAYILGVAGWGTGLKLGSESQGVTYSAHRNIGIALFCLATLQVTALLLRPQKDHKYRIYWNVYHHSVGYSVIIMSIINIFKGFDILDPAKKWKHTYIGLISSLAAIALILEVVTWIIVLKRRSRVNQQKSQNGVNGNGNGHARQSQVV